MDEETLTRICNSVISPLNNQIEKLSTDFNDKLLDLSKSIEFNVQSIVVNIKNEFLAELKKRDEEILKLKSQVSTLNAKVQKICENADQPTSLDSVILQEKRKLKPIQFKQANENKIEKDLVLIGDSLIKHVNLDLVNPGKNNELCCFRGATVDTIRKEIIDIDAKFSIKTLVLHVGSNCIPSDLPLSVTAQILDLVDQITVQMPNTKLLVSAILPKINAGYNPGINQINTELCNASLTGNFAVVQHKHFSRDGLINFGYYVNREVENEKPIHLNYGGVARLGCDIKYAL